LRLFFPLPYRPAIVLRIARFPLRLKLFPQDPACNGSSLTCPCCFFPVWSFFPPATADLLPASSLLFRDNPDDGGTPRAALVLPTLPPLLCCGFFFLSFCPRILSPHVPSPSTSTTKYADFWLLAAPGQLRSSPPAPPSARWLSKAFVHVPPLRSHPFRPFPASP